VRRQYQYALSYVEPGATILARRTAPLEYVASIRPVPRSTVQAPDLVDGLHVVCSRRPGAADDLLVVPVHEAGSCAVSRRHLTFAPYHQTSIAAARQTLLGERLHHSPRLGPSGSRQHGLGADAELAEDDAKASLREVEHRLLDLLADAAAPGIRVEAHLRAVLLDQRVGLASGQLVSLDVD